MGLTSIQKCPECGTAIHYPQSFCGECGKRLVACPNCKTTNVAESDYCHNCGKPLEIRETKGATSTPLQHPLPPQTPSTMKPSTPIHVHVVETAKTGDIDDKVLKYLEAHQGGISIRQTSSDLDITRDQLIGSLSRLQTKGVIETSTFVERMRNCYSCNKAIGANEIFCQYCGAKQILVEETGQQPILDPSTMKVALTMINRVIEAKQHPEYSSIDELTTTIGAVALGGEKPQDAGELSVKDQLRLVSLVFEYSRDKVIYKGESFGEYVRWPWETIKTGGDCDCKVVLLASMLASLAFRRMHFLILPPGTYLDTATHEKKKLAGHALLEVELVDASKSVPVRLDPSCVDCDVDDISASVKPFLSSFYRIPIIP